MKNIFLSVILTASVALLSACGGGGDSVSNADATVTMKQETSKVELLSGQQNVKVGVLAVDLSSSVGYVSIGGFEIGGEDLLRYVQYVYFSPVIRVGAAQPTQYVPASYLLRSPKGNTAVSFGQQPWFVNVSAEYEMYLVLKPGVPVGTQIKFTLGDVVNTDPGVVIVPKGSIGNVSVQKRQGYVVPQVTTNDSTSITTIDNRGNSVSTQVVRKLTLWCPSGGSVNCSSFWINLTSSDPITEVIASVNGVSMSIFGTGGNCSPSGSTYVCSYGVNWTILPGQNVDLVITSSVSVDTNWMSVYWTSIMLGDIQVSPILPTQCALFVNDGTGCSGGI